MRDFRFRLAFQGSGVYRMQGVCDSEKDGGNLRRYYRYLRNTADLCASKFIALATSAPEAGRFSLYLQRMPTELQGGGFRPTNAAAH
jgi:hypothetical protein